MIDTPAPRADVVELLVDLVESRLAHGADDEDRTRAWSTRHQWSTGLERRAAYDAVLPGTRALLDQWEAALRDEAASGIDDWIAAVADPPRPM